ncbi:MAG: hypothetical protein QGH83_09725 [Candidatus Pacebacteria bacterium]|nr:hypothetical protein [Candidatus Paceibacterota bacterium]
MPNENLEKLVQYARDKKPVAFKKLLHTEIGSRMSTKISDIKTNLSKTMFQSGKEEVKLDEKLKYEGKFKKGDTIKSFDFPPRGDRKTEHYISGKITGTEMRRGAKVYVIKVTNDSGKTSGGRVGDTGYVPMETSMDWNDRIVKEEVELDEGKLSKSDGERIDNIVANLKKNKKTKEFADKFKKDVMKSMDIEKSLENVLPDYKRGDKRYSAVSKYFNSTEEVELDEGGAYGNDRFLVKGNKAKLDNPKRGEKDGPNHVWAKNEKEALKKCKEEVELDEGKKLTSGGKKKAKKGSAVRVYTGDDVQLKDGVGTVIACQHKRDGPQRCLLKMRKSGKEIETTVHPREVIYSNVDNTTYSESLDEGSKEEYQKFFNSKLAKYKVKSPAELDDAQKKKFFNEIEKEWKAEDE